LAGAWTAALSLAAAASSSAAEAAIAPADWECFGASRSLNVARSGIEASNEAHSDEAPSAAGLAGSRSCFEGSKVGAKCSEPASEAAAAADAAMKARDTPRDTPPTLSSRLLVSSMKARDTPPTLSSRLLVSSARPAAMRPATTARDGPSPPLALRARRYPRTLPPLALALMSGAPSCVCAVLEIIACWV